MKTNTNLRDKLIYAAGFDRTEPNYLVFDIGLILGARAAIAKMLIHADLETKENKERLAFYEHYNEQLKRLLAL